MREGEITQTHSHTERLKHTLTSAQLNTTHVYTTYTHTNTHAYTHTHIYNAHTRHIYIHRETGDGLTHVGLQ